MLLALSLSFSLSAVRSCFQSNTFEMTPPPPKNFSLSLSLLVLARSISVNEQNGKKVSLINPDATAAEAGFECGRRREAAGVQ